MRRFRVIKYSSGFAVLDSKTGEEAWMSDGVDCLFTPTGKAMCPGTKTFKDTWEKALNVNPDETLEVYFFQQHHPFSYWTKRRNVNE